MEGYVHSLESFGSVDGPGIRYVIFLTGCPMRCRFCHNPDTWEMSKGTKYSADELLQKAMRYRTYWGSDGGITVSGGEPLMQIDFLTELFSKAHMQGINTCLDTSGILFTKDGPFFDKFTELMKYTDLVLLDIKNMDPMGHKILTGHDNGKILEMAEYLSEIGKPVWIRHVLVSNNREENVSDTETKSFSDRDEQLYSLRDFIAKLSNVKKVEVLPYHVFGVHKWELLGIPYALDGIEPPSAERIENAKRILETDKYL